MKTGCHNIPTAEPCFLHVRTRQQIFTQLSSTMQGTELERWAALVGEIHNKAFICSLSKSLQILRLLRLFNGLGKSQGNATDLNGLLCFLMLFFFCVCNYWEKPNPSPSLHLWSELVSNAVWLRYILCLFLMQMQTTIHQLALLPNLFHGFHSVFYLSPKRGIMYTEITFLWEDSERSIFFQKL